jgi:hypothetical protein
MNSIAAFALLSLILTLSPGPDNLLVLRSSLRGKAHRDPGSGRGGQRVPVLGLCSAARLTAIMAASAQTVRATQLAGAASLARHDRTRHCPADPGLATTIQRPATSRRWPASAEDRGPL